MEVCFHTHAFSPTGILRDRPYSTEAQLQKHEDENGG